MATVKVKRCMKDMKWEKHRETHREKKFKNNVFIF